MTFTVDDRLVDSSCGDGVITCRMNTRKTLIVTQIEVGLETVLRDIALPVFVGIQRPWVDVDIRVEFLNCDLVAACLQQLTDAGRNDSFTK